MRVEIRKLQRPLNVTSIYVTHDQLEAMTLADIIVVMRDGVIEQTGSPLDVFENPASQFVAGFIGSPQMNFFDGVTEISEGSLFLRNPYLHLPILSSRFGDAIKGGERVVAGFRPEDIVPQGHGLDPRHSVDVHTKVDITEMLGNETLLFSSLGDDEFISRMQQPRLVAPDETLTFKFNVERMHLFDAHTGTSIRAGENGPIKGAKS